MRGDVLLTRMRLRPNPGGPPQQDGRPTTHPVVRHANYPLRHFLALAASLSPAALYGLDRRAAYLARLPALYRC